MSTAPRFTGSFRLPSADHPHQRCAAGAEGGAKQIHKQNQYNAASTTIRSTRKSGNDDGSNTQTQRQRLSDAATQQTRSNATTASTIQNAIPSTSQTHRSAR
ncbi:hypothetical protein TcCL_Unassigned01429 [Trypanosoma cruzi]|nr:hypothetical protein TcCL_Unassigned01429 [Trypanosoma cruzi]